MPTCNVLSPRDLVSRPDNMDETVPHTCLKAWLSSNFNQIRPLTTELHALEHLKSQCSEHTSNFIGDCIFFILAGNKDNYNGSYSSKFTKINPRFL